mmetsp:Transcript_33509/g.41098  ORF Transcript_33509/g.41098 Transcript_33509/m.41098 type:complete len:689 (+) Transcript_33509:189-2255(+)|eukprot:CAMPEP_0204835596 /NCGR_PEP_ID=MMETSP1346-20131115/23035_1 /ASSEMBLY_ACC=CAM_ASM_000771 /TAXON_ID=215587 /ORGANISM="Aplanochytrium stocchinoi, Strain GSBS06" /LENGTH=688 /DNA_ID=CAMNT_0051969751 /DNA_START=137 /DNA_END=2203 /DNA_ORIENTATION=+
MSKKYTISAKDLSREKFLALYQKHELVIVKDAVRFWKKKNGLVSARKAFQSLEKLCDNFPDELQKTFTFEGKVLNKSETKICNFLKDAAEKKTWYISVILQESKQMLSEFFSIVPFEVPPLGLFHDECIWYFIGKAEDGLIPGRAEHKDIISSSGSWHLQTNWRKIWYVRERKEDTPITLEVKPGEMIFINTSRWFHQTEIPKTPKGELSISYARDFWLHQNDFQSCFTEADKTNIETPWANADVSKGDVILCEKPMFAVQDPQNRADYLTCQHCFAPLGSANLHLSCLVGHTSRKALIDEPTNPPILRLPISISKTLSEDFTVLVDPSTNSLYCSQECLDTARRSFSYHLLPSCENKDATNAFFNFILKSGYFESFYLAAVAFISNWIPSTRWDTDDLNYWWKADPLEGSCITMHCGHGMDVGFEMDNNLVVKSVDDAYKTCINVGDTLQMVSGEPVRTLEEVVKVKTKIDELRKANSINIVGIPNFPYDWVGVEFNFKRKQLGAIVTSDVAEVAENAWRFLFKAINEKHIETSTSMSKDRFFKLTRFFHTASREIGAHEGPESYLQNRINKILNVSEQAKAFDEFCQKTLGGDAKDLEEIYPRFLGQAYYEQISTIPSSSKPNCELCWVSDGLECTVIATKDIKTGEDLTLPFTSDEEITEEFEVEEEQSNDGSKRKKQRRKYNNM